MVNIDFITYKANDEILAIAHWAEYLLPTSWLQRIDFQDKNKAIKTLLGRILLYRRLSLMGVEPQDIPAMRYSTSGKPYFENGFHFSFAYEKGIIMVASSDKQAVGIDIEHIRPISWKEYEAYFEAEEWMKISKSKHPVQDLIAGWVTKEAATKLEGTVDLPIDRNQIKFNKRFLYLDGKKYRHQSIPLPSSYIGRLVTKNWVWRVKVNNVTHEMETRPMLYAVRA
jgi:phosphopantetheinyl transferase